MIFLRQGNHTNVMFLFFLIYALIWNKYLEDKYELILSAYQN